MRNKLLAFLREHQMVQPGDRVICAVSGGADSMALLWALFGLREKLEIQVEAAHFNHHLRGEESRRDAAFVEDFCRHHGIVCHLGQAQVTAGEKGLEAAAREARYRFLLSLPGKIATAHTADDNAETLLMHLVRGTGLKGLGGIAPVRDGLIRPMLTVTRQEVELFLTQSGIPWITDSSNSSDAFFRNRLRHHVIPLLKQENPALAQTLSAAALRLRQDEALLEAMTEPVTDVAALRRLPPSLRRRTLAKLLGQWGVREPEANHIALAEQLVFSDNPSARGAFPPNIIIRRNYGSLEKAPEGRCLEPARLSCPGVTRLPGLRITCMPASGPVAEPNRFAVCVQGSVTVRPRQAGDAMRLPGGTKRLKELFIDRKIPASERDVLAVIADEGGVLGVQDIGPNRDRTDAPNWEITIEKCLTSAEADE